MACANNATRLLDAKRIAYQALEIPTEKLSALEVAAYLGVDAEAVFKSIVFRRASPGKPVLALVPAADEVDAKKLAAALNEKKMLLASQQEAERLTGLQVGGISPLALLNRGFQVVLDTSAQERETIIISAGQRGLQVRLNAHDLARLSGARVADISASHADL